MTPRQNTYSAGFFLILGLPTREEQPENWVVLIQTDTNWKTPFLPALSGIPLGPKTSGCLGSKKSQLLFELHWRHHLTCPLVDTNSSSYLPPH